MSPVCCLYPLSFLSCSLWVHFSQVVFPLHTENYERGEKTQRDEQRQLPAPAQPPPRPAPMLTHDCFLPHVRFSLCSQVFFCTLFSLYFSYFYSVHSDSEARYSTWLVKSSLFCFSWGLPVLLYFLVPSNILLSSSLFLLVFLF